MATNSSCLSLKLSDLQQKYIGHELFLISTLYLLLGTVPTTIDSGESHVASRTFAIVVRLYMKLECLRAVQ